MRWGPPHLSQCRSSGTKINSWNGVWIGHGCRMMVVLLFDYHPIDHLQPEPLAFYRAVENNRNVQGHWGQRKPLAYDWHHEHTEFERPRSPFRGWDSHMCLP